MLCALTIEQGMSLNEDDFMMLVTLARLDRRLMRTSARQEELLSKLSSDDAREIAKAVMELKVEPEKVDRERIVRLRPHLNDILKLAGQSKLVA